MFSKCNDCEQKLNCLTNGKEKGGFILLKRCGCSEANTINDSVGNLFCYECKTYWRRCGPPDHYFFE